MLGWREVERAKSVFSAGRGAELVLRNSHHRRYCYCFYCHRYYWTLSLPGPAPSRHFAQPPSWGTQALCDNTWGPGAAAGTRAPTHTQTRTWTPTHPAPDSYLLLRSLRPAGPRGGPRDRPQTPRQGPGQAPCLVATCSLRPPPWRGRAPRSLTKRPRAKPSFRRGSVCRENRGTMRGERGNLGGLHGGGSRRIIEGRRRGTVWGTGLQDREGSSQGNDGAEGKG